MKNIQPQKSFKILLIGDSCEDVYVYGEVLRRCFEERPKNEGTPVLKVSSTLKKSGMSKNVYESLLCLNQEVDFFTNSEDVQKVRVFENNKNIIRIDYNDKVSPIREEIYKKINLKKYDCVVFSDYNKGFVSDQLINYVVKNYNGLIFVDSKKTKLDCYERCIIKINEFENSLVESFPNKYDLIVTLGKDGAKWKNKSFDPYPCEEVKDICGAGDAFFVSFIVSFLQNKNFERSIKVANCCATEVLQHVGNYFVTPRQFNSAMNKF